MSKKKDNLIWMILMAAQILMCVLLFVSMCIYFRGMRPRGHIITAVDLTCMIIAILLYVSIRRGGGREEENNCFMLLTAVSTLYLFIAGMFLCFEDKPDFGIVNYINNTIFTFCPVLMILLFWRMLNIWAGGEEGRLEKTGGQLLKAAAVIELILLAGNIFFGYFYSVSFETGRYSRGDLFLVTFLIPLIMIIVCFIRIIKADISAKLRAVLIAYLCMPYLASLIQIVTNGFSILAAATFVSVTFLYTNQYVARGLELEQKENELTRSRLRALQMQINPHFLYNTLASVAGLCETDPEAAEEMVFLLSDYMRDNFTDINKPIMIPFREELKRLDHYMEIEKMRFPDISLEKDIQAADFSIPVMSLQPLVENAIRHGIRKRRQSTGVIKISSFDSEDEWIIMISDDGAGFAGTAPLDKKGHLGIRNVRMRLQYLCGGSLQINSVPDQGTVCRITIPKTSNGGAA